MRRTHRLRIWTWGLLFADFSPSFWTVQISEELDGGGQLCRIMFSCVVLGFHFLLLVAFIEPAADVSAEDELGCSRSSVTEGVMQQQIRRSVQGKWR